MPTRLGLLCWSAVLVALCPVLVRADPPTDLYGDPLPKGALARLGTVRWQAEVPMCFVRYLPGDKQILTGSTAGRFQIWDVASGLPIRTFGRTTGPMRPKYATSPHCISLTPDGKTLVEASVEGNIRVWDVAAGKLLHTHKPKEQPANPTMAQMMNQNPPEVAAQGWAVAPDGGTLIVKDSGGDLTQLRLSDGKTLRILRAPGFKKKKDSPRLMVRGQLEVFNFVAFRNQGKEIVSVDSESYAIEHADGRTTIHLAGAVTRWDAQTGALLGQALIMPFHCQLAFSPDGKLLALADSESVGAISLHDALSGKQLRQLAPSSAGSGPPACLAFSPDGKRLALMSAQQEIHVWEIATGKETALLPRQDNHPYRQFVGFNDQRLTFSADSKTLAAAMKSHGNRRWDLTTGKEIQPRAVHHGEIAALVVTTDGKTVVTHGKDGTLRRWEVASGKPLSMLRLPLDAEEVTFSPDGTRAAFTTTATLPAHVRTMVLLVNGMLLPRQGYHLHLRDITTDKEDWSAWLEERVALLFSPDGKVLTQRNFNQVNRFMVRRHQANTGVLLPSLNLDELPFQILKIRRSIYFTNYALAFAPDGTSCTTSIRSIDLLSSRSFDDDFDQTGLFKTLAGIVRRWNLNIGKCDFEFNTGESVGLEELVSSSDGRTLAVVNADGQLSFWELASGRSRARLVGKVGGPRFSPDGCLLAAADRDGGVRVYDAHTGKLLTTFHGHRSVAMCVVFTPDGRRLISGGADGTALVWELMPLLQQLSGPSKLTAQQVEPLWAALASDDGAVAFQAVNALSLAPAQALPWLDKHLQPAPDVTAAQVRQWLDDLDAKKFTLRQQAAVALARQGMAAEPALHKALATNPSLEMRRRLEALLAQANKRVPSGQELRSLRAAEVLERIGTPAARTLLQRLARGGPTAPLTRDALAALRRLDGR